MSHGSRDIIAAVHEITASPPELGAGNVRIWLLEKRPDLAVYYMEPENLVSLRSRPHASLRLLVLSGRMKIRVGAAEREDLGPGAYVSIPRKTPYRIIRQGREKLLLVAILTPHDEVIDYIEYPYLANPR